MSTQTKTRFVTPPGRMVQGNLFEPNMTDQDGNPRVVKNGPNKGKPAPQYYVGLAIRKDDPDWPAFWALILTESAKAFPHLFPQGPNGPCTRADFAFKVMDGDGLDNYGKSNTEKEGFAGHWVVKLSSGFAPKVFPMGKFAPSDQIQDPNLARRGYYYRMGGTIDGNDSQQSPGVYLNFDMAELLGYGPEIVNGPDASEVFKAPARLPVGASPTPGAGSTASPVAGPGPSPAPSAPTASNGNGPGPYGGYRAPAAAQAPAPAPAPAAPPAPAPAPAAPPGPQMTPKAGAFTYEQYRQSGWTDDALRQAGMML